MARKRVAASEAAPPKEAKDSGRSRISQTDVPSYSLEQALRIPRAIGESYAYKPTKPLNVAAALDMSPTSGTFRGLCGAAIAFGLTSGGYNASEIKIEPLGMRIVRPLEEGDDLAATREALLRPRVFREFLQKYDGASLPRDDIARNVLLEMDVPADRTADVLQLISESAESVGFIREIKGKRYVDLGAPTTATLPEEASAGEERPHGDVAGLPEVRAEPEVGARRDGSSASRGQSAESHESNRRRVFITHGKNKTFIEPIKKLLAFGELEPVVSVEKQSVSQPVSDKVMGDMRGCGAAIIHVDAEQKLIDADAKEQIVLNPNVLIEIGGAMALFGRRFILLVREGIQLPSNLQGLFEVRYKGDNLDGDATIRLLEAINELKKHPLPLRYANESALAGEQ